MSFCSRVALAAPDVIAGTGVRADVYVFLPVPKRYWADDILNAGWASRAEMAAITAARDGGVVARCYNPPGGAMSPSVLVYAAPERPAPTALATLLGAFAGRWPVEAEPGPTLAICTHGTRDRCCAKWGFAAYLAARRLHRDCLSEFEPLECSHLGGDRFAATGIFFPSGGMYAHLDSADLHALTAAESTGRLTPERYRGRVFDSQPAQIARAGLAREGLYDRAAEPLEVTLSPEGTELLVIAEDGRRFAVEFATREVTFYSDCEQLAGKQRSRGRRTVYAGGRELASDRS